MKTRELTNPTVGMIVFNGDLMAKIVKVLSCNRFRFWVYNGAWGGEYYDGYIYVFETSTAIKSPPFVEVLDTTEEEKRNWYLDKRKQG